MEAGVERFVDADELGRFLQRIQFAARYSKSITIAPDLVEQALRVTELRTEEFCANYARPCRAERCSRASKACCRCARSTR